jgi:DNA-binding NarL/FixJ family response regulator
MFLPGGSEEQTRWFNELQRLSTTPDMAARIVEACDDIDVTDLAADVAAPTLVLHSNGDARVPASEGRLLASLIPNARFEELPSRNHVLLESEPAWPVFTRKVERALGVSEPGADTHLGRTAPSGTTSALTARERQILSLLAEGMTNKRIAGRLGLSPKTVRNYVSLILGKLGASTRTEAVAKSLRADGAPDSPPEERPDH